jgi:hypothetical protein
MKPKLLILILFIICHLQGCISNQGSSKYIWIWMDRNTIVPNVVVEGTYEFDGGSNLSPAWEGLINCRWITPVETNPQSIEFKYPIGQTGSHIRSLQNKRMRANGSLHIIPQKHGSQPKLYLAVDSLIQI